MHEKTSIAAMLINTKDEEIAMENPFKIAILRDRTKTRIFRFLPCENGKFLTLH